MSPEQALELARSTDNDFLRDRILAKTAPRLSAEAGLSVARSIGCAESRRDALVEIAGHLPEEQQLSCLWEAMSAAAAIEHAGSRANALGAIAQHPSLRRMSSPMELQMTEIIAKLAVHKRSE